MELVLDPSTPFQEYVEDCYVCCRPIVVTVSVVEDDLTVDVRAEDEA